MAGTLSFGNASVGLAMQQGTVTIEAGGSLVATAQVQLGASGTHDTGAFLGVGAVGHGSAKTTVLYGTSTLDVALGGSWSVTDTLTSDGGLVVADKASVVVDGVLSSSASVVLGNAATDGVSTSVGSSGVVTLTQAAATLVVGQTGTATVFDNGTIDGTTLAVGGGIGAATSGTFEVFGGSANFSGVVDVGANEFAIGTSLQVGAGSLDVEAGRFVLGPTGDDNVDFFVGMSRGGTSRASVGPNGSLEINANAAVSNATVDIAALGQASFTRTLQVGYDGGQNLPGITADVLVAGRLAAATVDLGSYNGGVERLLAQDGGKVLKPVSKRARNGEMACVCEHRSGATVGVVSIGAEKTCVRSPFPVRFETGS